jgi:hypothetical protein
VIEIERVRDFILISSCFSRSREAINDRRILDLEQGVVQGR